jgi:crotonobetainyl-CoA:carnitine CoA-transferase CaiB-like acyl-CoA transferase
MSELGSAAAKVTPPIGPLDGVLVLDLADDAGSLSARHLGELGADVIRVTSSPGPRSGDDTGTDLADLVRDLGKTCLHVESAADGRQLVGDLLTLADIVIIGRPDRLSVEDLVRTASRARPELIVVSVTDFGLTGPYQGWHATPRVHMALGCVLARSGVPSAPPLMPPPDLVTGVAAVQALLATLIALYHRLRTGAGDHVDVSVFEAMLQVFDPGFGVGGGALAGSSPADSPRSRPDAAHLYPIFACRDGHVRICLLSPGQWRGMFTVLGRPEEFSSPAYDNLVARYGARERLYPLIAQLCAALSSAELVEIGDRHGIPIGRVRAPAEVLDDEHFRARGTFATIDDDGPVPIRVPATFFVIEGHRRAIGKPARSSAGEALARWNSLAAGRKADVLDRPARTRPLEGIRVLDLGVIIVGAEAGRILADQGADVVKIESRRYPDGARQSFRGESISRSFARGNRGKRSFGLNLRDARGTRLFRQLAEEADVVLSNFKPGTLESLGLDSAALHEANPALVTVESSAFGATGPAARRMGYGPLVRTSTALTDLWRQGQTGPFGDFATAYPDHVSGRLGACAALAGLIAARRGRGVAVEVSQAEVVLSHLSDVYATESIRQSSEGAGPSMRSADVPHGVYPCAGDDDWCVVEVRDNADWEQVCCAIGRPDLLSDPSLATPAGRRSHITLVDRAVAEWTSQRSAREAMVTLQAAGVPAGMMLHYADLPDDPQLLARDFFDVMNQVGIEEPLLVDRGPALFGKLPQPAVRPAPATSDATVAVCRALLGLPDTEIAELAESGVIELPIEGETNLLRRTAAADGEAS